MAAATYRTHPVHVMPGFAVGEGYDALAADLQWDLFVAGLRAALERRGLAARWHSTAACFLSASRIDEILAPTLTDDPVFGRLWRGHLEELWDAARVTALRRVLSDRSETAVVSGFGASRLAVGDLRVYVDVPKDC